jgi:hypothetical protein
LGLAVVSLVVLAILGALTGLVLSRVLSSAGARNQKRPGSGGSRGHRSDQELRDEAETIRRTGPVLGVATAAAGVPLALVGAVLATGIAGDASFTDTVPATTLATFLGLIGYFLGARRVGRAAMIFAVVALLFGLSASQGYVPGIEATDHGMPAKP